jgi:hypothetical protein
LCVLAALAVLLTISPSVAAAAPGDPEGDAGLLAKVEAASRGYLDAQAALAASKQRQADLVTKLADAEGRAAGLSDEVGQIASAAYRTGGSLGEVSALLDSGSPDSLIQRASTLAAIGQVKGRQLRELAQLRADLAKTKADIDAEVANQQKQLAEMAKRKSDAERALAGASSGPGGTSSAVASPAPRRPDGSWPPESCSITDPTGTGGCVTPRMLHAYQQARAAGFTHYTKCWRTESSGEHPKGRACDFAAAANTFGGVAAGAERTYGNNLAAYFIANASRLAVLYVIWFRQIWLPSSGWRSYSGATGQPNTDHTNHVHCSVY